MKVPTNFNISLFNIKKIQEPVKAMFAKVSASDDRVLFEPLKLKHHTLGDIFIHVSEDAKSWNKYKIEIEDKIGHMLGKELLSVDKDNKKMYGFDIFVSPEYRNKQLGELLRLFSLMIMKENKSPHLKIYSKNSAVYFHSKYKFEPQIWQFMDRDKALESIVENSPQDAIEFSRFAQNIQERVSFYKNRSDIQRDLCQETQELVKEYIDFAMQKDKPAEKCPLKWGMDMVLTKDKTEANKEFFNKLYAEHGLDYSL